MNPLKLLFLTDSKMNTLSYNHHDHYETILCHLKRSLISREIYKNVRSSPLSARFCCNGLPTFLIHSQFNIKELVGGGFFESRW